MAERLAVLGLVLLAAIAPMAAVFAPRALALFLPVAAVMVLPLLWPHRAALACWLRQRRVMLLVFFTLVGIAAWRSPAKPAAVMAALEGAFGYGLSFFLLAQAIGRLAAARLWQVWRLAALCLPVTAMLIASESLSGMWLNTKLNHLTGGGQAMEYDLDRGTVVASLFMWALVAGFNLRGQGWLSWIILAASTVLITFTTSQSATVGIYAGALVYMVYPLAPRLFARLMRGGIFTAFMTMPFIAALLVAWLGYDNDFWPAASVGQRLVIWGFAVVHIFDQPWLGYGLEAMRALAPVHGHTHNGALQLWLEFGLPGALFAGVALMLLLRRVEGLPVTLARTAHAAFAGWAVVFCVGYGIWQAWWMCTGLSIILLFVMLRRLQPSVS